ncbi:ABC transporter substrate-binding protein [Labrys wisconsinensis]|uniref:Trehalose/maltose transport system substrate-binding protein n=1 Tax=Labrys wisconsinensis TaxID=425677 RepID=A0ABU0J4T4_9HYPH|nr:ABC transporter substrate-binding protein [Labrys wisconsinensis]MDQ0468284.1 trehalose/maltose transport system substrate-binding protein [Labrys wisconsinensis]
MFRRLLLAATATIAMTGLAHAAEIGISCGAVGQELALCKEGAEAWAKKTGNSVKIISTPNDTNERLALYQQLLSAGAGDIDVFQVDVIWPGILGNHFIDLAPYSKGAEKAHFPAIIDNNTIDGKLLAMPWFTDAGVLYYRKDLLEKYGLQPPATWQELTEAATKIQDGERKAGNDKFFGFVFQGRAYEGLTCDALEWIDSFGGGAIVDGAGKITINNPKAVEALTLAASWIGKITPDGVLNYGEEEARGVFQSGNAAFMRNWPYAWSLANNADSPIKDKVGVSALPKGGADGKNTGTLGGWQLAVSKYSKNQDAAADLVMYLTSKEEQKRRAIAGSYNPTIAALYEDPDVLKAVPFFGSLKATFTSAVARPSKITGDKYNKVSNAFWNAVHTVLSGKAQADASLASLDGELKRIKRNKW